MTNSMIAYQQPVTQMCYKNYQCAILKCRLNNFSLINASAALVVHLLKTAPDLKR